MRLTV